ncbi:calpain-8 [Loxodonta africana]|uniref:calpain-8 n=1 Tax=Loxodonta africana TaxID=9785 RepID=UPI0030CB993A
MAAMAAGVSKKRAVAQGLGSNQKAVKYLGQDFETLRQQCLDSGVLFKDPEFPACPSALGYRDFGPHSPQTQGIVWKRPTELCPSPQFIVGGATRTDICQGGLGDCWLLAAIASLTLNEELLYRVVPKDQSFQKGYAGIFHFQFWQYGEWVEVVIDDRLPTRDGQLLFLHSEEGSEFWSALLEKAYAKLNGSYEALVGGSTMEGFEDFTGGISEFYDLKKPPTSLYQIIRKALRAGSLLGCSIDVSRAGETEAITSQKLVKSHAYSITGAEEVDFRGRPEKLIRLRNPWGNVEWRGAWSDDAPEWNYIDPRLKEELDKKAEDGEFWMSFSDFLRQFSRLEICNLSPDSLTSEEVHKWNLALFNGRWVRGSTAGGCQNYPATYWTNPQFKIRLEEVDDSHEEYAGEPHCTVLLGLMQKNRRRQKRIGQSALSIGYAVYQVPKELGNHTDVHLGQDFFRGHQPSARSSTYVNLREVTGRAWLPPGEYLVVPSTFEPFKDGEFCLRVFSEKKATALCVLLALPGDSPKSPKLKGSGDYFPALLGEEPPRPWHCVPPHPSEVEQEDSQFKSLFEKLSGQDSEISASELKTVLNGVFSKRNEWLMGAGPGGDGCRVFGFCLGSQEIYQETDYNHTGTIDAHEMRTALKKAGFTLSNQVQQTIAMRYANSKLSIDFEGFVACMIRLESLFSCGQGRTRRQNQLLPLGGWGQGQLQCLCGTLGARGSRN